jgi:hypothetical protein
MIKEKPKKGVYGTWYSQKKVFLYKFFLYVRKIFFTH